MKRRGFTGRIIAFFGFLDDVFLNVSVRVLSALGWNQFRKHKTAFLLIHDTLLKFEPYTARFFRFYIERRTIALRLPGVMDPINLIFIGDRATRVQEVLERHGWVLSGGSNQYVRLGGRITFPALQMKYIVPSNPDEQYHLRLYEAKNREVPWSIGAVHHEYYDHHEENHIVYSWEGAEELVTQIFKQRGYHTRVSHEITKPNWGGKPNDGKATIIDFAIKISQ